jgi:hypothetical protein
MCSAQLVQNVHSKLQIVAAASCGSGALHRSQAVRISSTNVTL